MDVSAGNSEMSTTDAPVTSDYTYKLRMNKNEAALQILGIAIPAGYSIGGQSAAASADMGTLVGKLSTDNPWSPGQVLDVTGTLKATGLSNEWELFVDYPSVVNDHPTLHRNDRTHKVSIATPSEEAAGAIKIEMAPNGDKAHNQGTETWTLTIYGKVNQTGTNLVTNPSVKGVYRWLAAQHTTIDVGDSGQELFSNMSGNQAVVIKDLS
jgi:hypothetical protein